MAIFTNLPENDFRNYLEHHGVKGQKWYKRQYQNPDGSLTELGRQHYGVGKARGTKEGSGSGAKQTEAQKALEKGPSGFKDIKSYLEAITKDCFSMSAGQLDYRKYKTERNNGSFTGENKRANDAADLGLRALQQMDKGHTDIDDNDWQGWREWFLWEDQTIGMPMVADLINKGYTANQVKKLVDELDKNLDYYDVVYSEGPSALSIAMFDVMEGNWNNTLKGFAEACESIKKDENDFSNKAPKVPKQTKTEAKLANVSDKIDSVNDKKQSPKYQKMLEKRAKLEDELGRAEALATIARDKKILYDKNLSFLDKLNIKHAEKLKKQIAKIDHETYKLDASINKLTAKQDRYKKLLDSFENSKSAGELSNRITDATFKGAPLKEIKKLSGADFDGDTVVVYKNDAATREAMRVAKAKGWDSLTKKQKELLSDANADSVGSKFFKHWNKLTKKQKALLIAAIAAPY